MAFMFKRDGDLIQSVRTCPVCDGSGLYTLEEPTCPQCDGKGLIWDCDYVQSLLDRIAELEAAQQAEPDWIEDDWIEDQS